ncbi:hypothetical protein LINPERHAP1_LOCUS14457 [Linum perenne]
MILFCLEKPASVKPRLFLICWIVFVRPRVKVLIKASPKCSFLRTLREHWLARLLTSWVLRLLRTWADTWVRLFCMVELQSTLMTSSSIVLISISLVGKDKIFLWQAELLWRRRFLTPSRAILCKLRFSRSPCVIRSIERLETSSGVRVRVIGGSTMLTGRRRVGLRIWGVWD